MNNLFKLTNTSLLFLLLSLAACSTISGPVTPQVSYVQACASYGALLNTAVTLREQGKASAELISQVNLLEPQLTPLCSGTMPADPTVATQKLTAAVTTLTILEAAKASAPTK